MQRKVIQLAGKTLLVSLPHAWAKQHGINKGQTVHVNTTDTGLLISPTEPPRQRITEKIEADGLNASLLWYKITGAYTRGADEITITSKKPTIPGRHGKGTKVLSSYVAEIADGLIGMEVVRSSTTHSVLRELSAHKPEELDAAVNRIFHTLSAMVDETIAAILNDDKQANALARTYEAKINKLHLYCLRIIATSSYGRNATLLTTTILSLEAVADELVEMLTAPIDKGDEKTISLVQRLVHTIPNAWHNPSTDKATEIYNIHREVLEQTENNPTRAAQNAARASKLAMMIIQAKLANPSNDHQANAQPEDAHPKQ